MKFKALTTRIHFWLKTEIFFSRVAHCPHVSVENGHRKHIFSKMHSRMEIYKNAGFSFTCRWTKGLFT